MNNYTIYALKGHTDSHWKRATFSSLEEGEGRFGWSYIKTADLNQLQDKIDSDGWRSLSLKEKDCFQGFLLEIKEGDYVVYINVPEWGRCTLARVTCPYFWRYEDDDCNHRFHVDPKSVRVFGRNDSIVHPALSRRMKLQGRWWRIDLHSEFENLVKALEEGRGGQPRIRETTLHLLAENIQPHLKDITEEIHRTHPNFGLEELFEEIFNKVPGVQKVTRYHGRGDHGADLLVTFESGILIPGFEEQLRHCVVQVKSYEGTHRDTGAVDDIRRAFDHYPEATMGLIISTASSSSKELDDALDKLQEETGKPTALLIGADVAAFLLRFGGNLLR